MKDTPTAIFTRYSCRSFKHQALSEDQITLILQAAQAGPTARNRQELRFTWIDRQDLIRTISDRAIAGLDPASRALLTDRGVDTIFYGAPHVLVISAPATDYSGLDAGIACQTACLMATAQGLASCIVGLARPAFDRKNPDNLCAELGFAPTEDFMISIAFGLANTSKEAHESNPQHIRRISS